MGQGQVSWQGCEENCTLCCLMSCFQNQIIFDLRKSIKIWFCMWFYGGEERHLQCSVGKTIEKSYGVPDWDGRLN